MLYQGFKTCPFENIVPGLTCIVEHNYLQITCWLMLRWTSGSFHCLQLSNMPVWSYCSEYNYKQSSNKIFQNHTVRDTTASQLPIWILQAKPSRPSFMLRITDMFKLSGILRCADITYFTDFSDGIIAFTLRDREQGRCVWKSLGYYRASKDCCYKYVRWISAFLLATPSLTPNFSYPESALICQSQFTFRERS